MWTATNQPFQSNKMVQQIRDLPCIRFIITVDHYCFVCLFGALVFVSRILANLCVFFGLLDEISVRPCNDILVICDKHLGLACSVSQRSSKRSRTPSWNFEGLPCHRGGVDIYNAATFYFAFSNSSSRKIMHLQLHSQSFAVKWSFHASSDCHHSFFIVRSCEFSACCLINFQLCTH